MLVQQGNARAQSVKCSKPSWKPACEQALHLGISWKVHARVARERRRDKGPSRLRRSLARSRAAHFARPNRRACSQASWKRGSFRAAPHLLLAGIGSLRLPSLAQDIFPSEGSDVLANIQGDVLSYAEELKEENCCSLDNCEGDGAQILTKDIP